MGFYWPRKLTRSLELAVVELRNCLGHGGAAAEGLVVCDERRHAIISVGKQVAEAMGRQFAQLSQQYSLQQNHVLRQKPVTATRRAKPDKVWLS